MSRRGFTLIEAVMCVVVLALAVPPTLELLGSTAADRADAINTTRAAMFAELVLESCLADCASDDPALGFAAFADGPAYRVGLDTRIGLLAAPYTDLGMTYTLGIGPLVDRTGAVNADSTRNLFRVVTVTIAYPSASGDPYELPVSVVLGAM